VCDFAEEELVEYLLWVEAEKARAAETRPAKVRGEIHRRLREQRPPAVAVEG
jgi:hypothetical protein